jgi:hypothetical protein
VTTLTERGHGRETPQGQVPTITTRQISEVDRAMPNESAIDLCA